MDKIFEGLQGQIRMTNLMEVDNHESVNIGDVEKNSEARRWSGPSSTKRFSRMRTSKKRWVNLTHREGEEGTLRAFMTSTKAWRERDGRTCITSYKIVEMNKEGNVRHSSGSSRAKTQRKIRGGKERCDAYYDQTSEQKIVNREVCTER